MNEDNNKAIKDMVSKTNAIISYNVDKESCYETNPCCHDITVTLDDGRILHLCVSEEYARMHINNKIKFH